MLIAAALADSPVPVLGQLSDPAGNPVSGTGAVRFRLYGQVGVGTPDVLVDQTTDVAFSHGHFAAVLRLSDVVADSLGAYDTLQVTTTLADGVESGPVDVGWAPRALYASRAGHASTADALTQPVAWGEVASRPALLSGLAESATTWPVSAGGTGASSAAGARAALDAAKSGANTDITSLTGLTTPLSLASGGTGVGSFSANAVLLGNGTNPWLSVAPGASGNVLTSNGTTWSSAAPPTTADVARRIQAGSSNGPCSEVGLLVWDAENSRLGICDGSVFRRLAATIPPPASFTLQPGAAGLDSYVRSSLPTTVFGAEEGVRVGGWGDTYDTMVRFDLTGVSATPATSAQIHLYCWSTTSPANMTFELVTSSWNESTVWNSRPTANAISTVSPPAAGSWLILDVTTAFNGWVAGTTPNHGIRLRPTNTSNSWVELRSSDFAADASLRPKLVVTYPP